jgi:membrane protease YdiL (CAAX protease family)
MESIENNDSRISPRFLWSWKDLFIILLGIAGIFIIGIIIYAIFLVWRGANPEDLMKPTVAQTLGLAGLEAFALIGGIYLFGVRRRGLSWDAVGLRPVSTSWILIATVATLVAIPIVGLVTILAYFVLGQPLENPQLDFLLPEGLSAFDALAMLFLAGFAAPFGEELLFRGILYSMFRERWGIWLGVLVSSLLFGLIHGNLAVGLTGFLLGILTAIVFEYSDSLWTAVLVHALNNSIKIVLLYLLVVLGFSVGS